MQGRKPPSGYLASVDWPMAIKVSISVLAGQFVSVVCHSYFTLPATPVEAGRVILSSSYSFNF